MIEIMAIIRPNRTADTKRALIEVGFAGYTCIKAIGRGKKPVEQVLPDGTRITTKLVNKRLFLIVVPKEEEKKVVSALMKANCYEEPGDGKIFVSQVEDSFNIHHACHD